MHRSKPISLLQALDAAELKRLYQFLKSPFYNANPHIVKLYLLLRKEHPDFTSPQLAKENLFRKLFPGRAYGHQKLLNLMSDFTGLLKQYLQVLQLENEEQAQDSLLLKAFASRPHCYDSFVKQVRKTGERLDALPSRNADYYRQKYRLRQLYFNHPGTDQFQLTKGQYDEAMQNLDQWFLLEKLSLSCETKAREKPLAETYDIWLLPEIRHRLARYPAKSPIAGAYLGMLDLLERGEEDVYFQLKALLVGKLPQFSRKQQQNILQSLINYAIRKGNRGQAVFLRENLGLYQFGLSQQLFLEHGMLNDMIYINIVNISLRTGEAQWCSQFIGQYAPALEPNVRKDAETLALALWLYAQDKPDAAIELLHQVDFKNVYYQVQSRVLLIKVYVEALKKNETYTELIQAQSEAFERFLKRNRQVAPEQKAALLNFALIVKRLAKLKRESAFGRPDWASLRPELLQMEPLYNKSWLLRQLK